MFMPKRYIIALVAFAVVFFGGIAILISLISGGNKSDTPKNDVKSAVVQKKNTLSKDTKKVTYSIYGRVVGEESRRAIRISITTSERKIEVLSGYDESVVKSAIFPNKQSAYEGFLFALEPTNFTSVDSLIKTDDRTVCPTGNRFVYNTDFQDNTSVRGWSTTCSAKIGNFKGNTGLIQTLFQEQIPDYQKFIADVNL